MNVSYNGLVIAAPASGCGKTTVTLGILQALLNKGIRVGAAKIGPDYIDPRFHECVTGVVSYNLDFWAMRKSTLGRIFVEAGSGSEILIVEGVMGLFDGALNSNSTTADAASFFNLPIILVVDAQAHAQSAGAVVKGFDSYRADCKISGVIFNRVGGLSHQKMVKEAMESLEIPIIGSLPFCPDLKIPSRHLGLVQAEEKPAIDSFLKVAGKWIEDNVELDLLVELASKNIRELSFDSKERSCLPVLAPLGQVIAIAYDSAFAFCYPHILHYWRSCGAEVSFFSPLANEQPRPDADAIFLPGGYPELHAGRLGSNQNFISSIRQACKRGVLIYGECGGFMTLGKAIIDAKGQAHSMIDLLEVVTSFATPKLQIGYRYIKHQSPLPWPQKLRGHEFHYASVVSQAGDHVFSISSDRLAEIPSGLCAGSVMGSFMHVIDAEPSIIAD